MSDPNKYPYAPIDVPPPDEDPLADIRHLGNPNFIRHVQGMLDTHVRKAAGYSGSDNPDTWANFREATAWGLTPLEGCLVRMGDKYRRVQNLRRNAGNERVGESIRDTLLDLANYAIIAVCLMDEEEAKASADARESDRRAIEAGGCICTVGIDPVCPALVHFYTEVHDG